MSPPSAARRMFPDRNQGADFPKHRRRVSTTWLAARAANFRAQLA
jgi:hypothetical protein